jgi:hypothetical protein
VKGLSADLGAINITIVLEDNPSDVVVAGSAVELRRATLLTNANVAAAAREEKVTPLRLLAGTWNVGNKAPPEGSTLSNIIYYIMSCRSNDDHG